VASPTRNSGLLMISLLSCKLVGSPVNAGALPVS
jgi:hypothetical protein